MAFDYPPLPYRAGDDHAIRIIAAHPFAHVVTAHGGLHVTRVPCLLDRDAAGRPHELRAHFDARNPQAIGLDGSQILVAFSGPASYVSPNWRADKGKGGTYDYEAVNVTGRVRVVRDLAFFCRLIDDLSALIEPQHAEVAAIGGYPVWQTPMAPPNHIARQIDALVPFVVEIEHIETIRKLHQDFSVDDRRSVADHLAHSHRDGARAIAALIRDELP